ncbi:MAG TPA: hypothetical protein VF058_02125 [Actinomycetota bacterium]
MTRAPERVPDPTREWATLPTSRAPRWFLPRRRGTATRRSFMIYHPVTLRSRVGWEAARRLAAVGALELLRPSNMLPREVWEPVAGVIPQGGALAVARANHPGRFLALVVGADGDLLAFLKVARDSVGSDVLERERRALETYGPLLPPPLFTPRVLDGQAGSLLLEAIEWRSRAIPWGLPTDVAHAMGRFYAASVSEGSQGVTQGDFTPWNLLRAPHGWALVDWESAESGVPPFFDLFHFFVQSSAELRRPSKRAVIEGLDLRGWVGACVEAYSAGAGVDPRAAKDLFGEYLRFSAARVSAGAPPRARRIRRELAARLGAVRTGAPQPDAAGGGP